MKFKNRTTIKIKGLNQERALNNLAKKVDIYNLKRKEQNIAEFEVDFRKRKQTLAIIKEQGLEILSISHKGFISSFGRLFSSYGLLIGIIISILFYCVQYNFIWKIEVWGTEEVESSEIIDFANKNLNSRFRFSIDTENLEIKLKDNFDQISSVSVAIVGQSLIINLNEATMPDEMEGEYQPIISEFDGMITQITLIQGTLNVKVGDIVQKGDILVYPYIIDSQGEQREVNPKATIMADIWHTASIHHYDYYIETKRTGRKIVNSEVLLLGLSIYQNKNDINFEQYETEEYIENLTHNLIIPFKLKKTIFYEVEIIEHIQPFEEVKDEKIEQARQKALIFLQENEIIINENYTIKEDIGCFVINYTITTNRNIGNT